jgi:hypothetical protein
MSSEAGARVTTRMAAGPARTLRCGGRAVVLFAACLLTARPGSGQQFTGDNQWVAPKGVATFVLTVGQEYSTFLAVAALLRDTEFNIGVTRFVDDPFAQTGAHCSGIFYVKRRLKQNEAENAGWAVSAGTGIDPSHLEAGAVTDTLDLLPGVTVNLNRKRRSERAWGMTWCSRAAVY